MLRVYDSETSDVRDISAWVTVLTDTPDASSMTWCSAHVTLGSAGKPLSGAGYETFEIRVTVGGQSLPTKLTDLIGPPARGAIEYGPFMVPANAEVIVQVLSPNLADNSVHTYAYLCDMTSANMQMINGAETDGTPAVASRPILYLQQLNLHCDLSDEGALSAINDNSGGDGIHAQGERGLKTVGTIAGISGSGGLYGALYSGTLAGGQYTGVTNGFGVRFTGAGTGQDMYLSSSGTIENAAGNVIEIGSNLAMVALNLDHLCLTACAGNVITGAVNDNTIIAHMLCKAAGDISDYDPADDSAQGASDRQSVSAAGALVAYNLDHLISAACPGGVITGAVVDNSVFAFMLTNDGNISDYNDSDHSLEAIGDEVIRAGNVVDDIHDTADDIESKVDTLTGYVLTIDTVVDAILVDTGTTLPASIATLDTILDKFDTMVEADGASWKYTAGSLAGVAGHVTVEPVSITVSSSGLVSQTNVSAYQYAGYVFVIAIYDEDDAAIDMSGIDIAFTVWDTNDATGAELFTRKNYGGDADIVVGGLSNNQLTVTGDDTDTQSAGNYDYVIRDMTNDRVRGRGIMVIYEALDSPAV